MRDADNGEPESSEAVQVLSGDEAAKIFLCASGDADDVSSDMKDFLDWLSGKQGRSRLVGKLENAVQKVKDHKEWRIEYMTPEEFKEAMEKPVSV